MKRIRWIENYDPRVSREGIDYLLIAMNARNQDSFIETLNRHPHLESINVVYRIKEVGGALVGRDYNLSEACVVMGWKKALTALAEKGHTFPSREVGESALHLACRRGDLPMCRHLISLGADSNGGTEWSPLQVLKLKSGLPFEQDRECERFAKVFLDKGGDPWHQSAGGKEWSTPLNQLMNNGHASLPYFLLKGWLERGNKKGVDIPPSPHMLWCSVGSGIAKYANTVNHDMLTTNLEAYLRITKLLANCGFEAPVSLVESAGSSIKKKLSGTYSRSVDDILMQWWQFTKALQQLWPDRALKEACQAHFGSYQREFPSHLQALIEADKLEMDTSIHTPAPRRDRRI